MCGCKIDTYKYLAISYPAVMDPNNIVCTCNEEAEIFCILCFKCDCRVRIEVLCFIRLESIVLHYLWAPKGSS